MNNCSIINRATYRINVGSLRKPDKLQLTLYRGSCLCVVHGNCFYHIYYIYIIRENMLCFDIAKVVVKLIKQIKR